MTGRERRLAFAQAALYKQRSMADACKTGYTERSRRL